MEQTAKEALLLFSCPGCGSQLEFNAKKQALECKHCGTQVAIERGTSEVKELSLKQQLSSGLKDNPVTIQQLVYQCNRCGASTAYTSETTTFICSSCQYEVVNPVAYKTRVIQPSSMIPFEIDKQQALGIFQKWVGEGFFRPKDLSQLARQDMLRGLYLPYWTYDADTHSEWSGYGGRYYYTTEYYTDSQGKRQSRQVQHTEWIYRTGTYDRFYDDVMVSASTEIPEGESVNVFPYNLEALVNFDNKYLPGWQADVYDIPLEDGYSSAERTMDMLIESACTDLLRIDTYRDLQVETQFSNQTYKHILLPLWICTYFYKNKQYKFMVNGQTGKIVGDKPVSAGKVAVFVLIILAIIALIIYFANQ